MLESVGFGPTRLWVLVQLVQLAFPHSFEPRLHTVVLSTKLLSSQGVMARPIIHKTPEAKLAAAREKRRRYYAKYVTFYMNYFRVFLTHRLVPKETKSLFSKDGGNFIASNLTRRK